MLNVQCSIIFINVWNYIYSKGSTDATENSDKFKVTSDKGKVNKQNVTNLNAEYAEQRNLQKYFL